jgi:hypothetical protein
MQRTNRDNEILDSSVKLEYSSEPGRGCAGGGGFRRPRRADYFGPLSPGLH